MNYPYTNNYLKSEVTHYERNLIAQKIVQMGKRLGKIEEKWENVRLIVPDENADSRERGRINFHK